MSTKMSLPVLDIIMNYKNKKDETLLMVAVRLGCLVAVELLLANGADYSACTRVRDTFTALHMVTQKSVLPFLGPAGEAVHSGWLKPSA